MATHENGENLQNSAGDDANTQQPGSDKLQDIGVEEGDINDVAITQQPGSVKLQDIGVEEGDINEKDSSVEKEGPSAEIGLSADPDGCVDASAGCGSVSKDLCDGAANLEFVYPNVGCTLSCDQETLAIVSDCTWEICSANFLCGLLLCTLGLAFDTKLVWTAEEAEFMLMGTGLDTSEGFALTMLGSKIGIADEEKRAANIAKKKLRLGEKGATKPDTEESGQTNEGAEGDE